METAFTQLSVLIKNEGSLLPFSKEMHWEAKSSSKILAFSTIFVIALPDLSISVTEGVTQSYSKRTFGFARLSLDINFFEYSSHLCISCEVSTFTNYSA